MSDGFDGMIDALRALGRLGEVAAAAAAPHVQDALRATAAAGTAPDGTPWPRTEKGAKAFPEVAERIRTKVVGGTILRTTLTGHAVYGHFGGGRNPRRPVLPDPGTIPPTVAGAIRRGAAEAFAKAVG